MLPPPPDQLQETVDQAARNGHWYRADVGVVVETPRAGDVHDLDVLCNALRDRIAVGEKRLSADPGNPKYQRYLALLRIDLAGTEACFIRALMEYESVTPPYRGKVAERPTITVDVLIDRDEPATAPEPVAATVE